MNPLAAVPFWAVLIAAWFACRWVVRTLSAGWTAVRAEKSIHRHGHLLARAAGKEK